MKIIATAVAAFAAALVPAAMAQDNLPEPVNSDDIVRERRLAERYGPFPSGEDPRDRRDGYYAYDRDNRYYGGVYGREHRQDWRDDRWTRRWSDMECWNPRARHFEEVRPDERQDDLDFSRCRPQRWR